MALRDFEKIFRNNPLTNPKDIYFYLDYRISVLKDGIIRIEKAKSLRFVDNPTQFAINRYFTSPKYDVIKKDDGILFKMKYFSLFFNGDFKTSFVQFNDLKLPLKSGKNLGGTYSTVDGYNGAFQIDTHKKIKMSDGVLTRNGLYLLDDSSSYEFNSNYEFCRQNTDDIDIYLFFYPNMYREAIRDFFEISGYPPLLPKYVFGNWWSRYYPYSQDSYLYLLKKFKEDEIPFTIATIDMDWHYSTSNGRDFFKDIGINETEFIKEIKDGKKVYYIKSWNEDWLPSIGWTGYTFNKALYSNPKKMLEELRNDDYHITLNLHPADGIAFYEESYSRVVKALGLDYKNKETVEFELLNNKNREVYFNEVLLPLEKNGVDFWWIDWQQGENSNFPGLSPLWICNHYFFLENYRGNNRPLILSRFAGKGSHRYPLGFSGDSTQTFDTLKFSIETTSQASNIGFSYWSHDIGGHFLGEKNSELFLKSVQFGCFSPINRLHCSCSDTMNKNPDLYLGGYGELVKKYLSFRHKLIPYIYSYSIETHYTGKTLLSPLYYDFPNDENSYKYCKHEYIFASNLLVAPFYKKKGSRDLNKLNVYFPDTFYDIHFGYKYNKGSLKTIYRENDCMPIFLKEGSFLILDKDKKSNSIVNPKIIKVLTTTGNGDYEFIEDDDNGNFFLTSFINKRLDINHNEIVIKFSKNQNLFDEKRIMKFRLLNVHRLKEVKIEGATITKAEDFSGFVEFDITDFNFDKTVKITYEFDEFEFSKTQRDLLNRVIYLDEDNSLRDELYNVIKKASTKDEIINTIDNKYKGKWFEGLFRELL